MTIDFLTMEDVLFLHENQITLYGGTLGLRDVGLLESAIAQPQASFDGEYLHGNRLEMAAAYLFHIVQNHPFLDGNKRTGAVAALVFLDINHVRIKSPQGILYDLVIGVATGSVGKDEITQFFRSYAE